MSDLVIREFVGTDTNRVIDLWRECRLLRPWNDPEQDIARKMADSPWGLLVAEREVLLVGALMVGYDGHRGWLYYLASDPTRRREGIGRALVDEAERRMLAMGCPKVQLMVRPGNEAVLAFYDALGYERFDASTTGKRLIADDAPEPE